MEAWMLDKPCLHVGVFVGGVVVQNHVDCKTLGYLPIDSAKKLQELFVTVTWQTFTDH